MNVFYCTNVGLNMVYTQIIDDPRFDKTQTYSFFLYINDLLHAREFDKRFTTKSRNLNII